MGRKRTGRSMIKQLIKPLVSPALSQRVRARMDSWRLTRAIRLLRRRDRIDDDMLRALRVAWGNEGFSADLAFLREAVRHLEASDKPVLECGTGVTTVLAGLIGERRGGVVVALDQDPQWSLRAQSACADNGIGNVRIVDAPLSRRRDHVWYDFEPNQLPKHIGVVICDGPFVDRSWGAESWQCWRYGIVPFLYSTGRTFEKILLDDLDDGRAPAIVERWSREFGTRATPFHDALGDGAIITPA